MNDPQGALAATHGLVEGGRGRGGGTIGEAEHAGQTPAGGGVGGQRMGLFLLDQLQPVFHRAQESIGVGQDGTVLTAHVAGSGQLVQRTKGGPVPDGGVMVAVDELEQLDGEFHVADSPRTPFDLEAAEPGARRLGLGARLHRPQLRQLVGAEGPLPQGVVRRAGEVGTELGAAGHRTRLQKGLEFPGLGPRLPVRAVRHQGPGERPGAAFGPQVDVDTEASTGYAQHVAGDGVAAG